jgi:hypothetical protein
MIFALGVTRRQMLKQGCDIRRCVIMLDDARYDVLQMPADSTCVTNLSRVGDIKRSVFSNACQLKAVVSGE